MIECSEYQVLDSNTRNNKYDDGENYFVDHLGIKGNPKKFPTSSDWKGAGWYRLLPPAGTVIPESSPGGNYCGAKVQGWVRGQHPVTPGQVTNTTICFHANDDECESQVDAMITNCDSYFVYFLPEAPVDWWSYGYCGADSL